LIKGLEYLLPLTQKQLALELDIGESTLSRLIKNKYMETPIGIIKIQSLIIKTLMKVNG
jgi:RNA polymerase sigma-54 factor